MEQGLTELKAHLMATSEEFRELAAQHAEFGETPSGREAGIASVRVADRRDALHVSGDGIEVGGGEVLKAIFDGFGHIELPLAKFVARVPFGQQSPSAEKMTRS